MASSSNLTHSNILNSVSKQNRMSRRAKMDYNRTRIHFADDDEKYKGVSKDYFDHGDQSFVICHAKLWIDEGKRGQSKKSKVSFNLCCQYGAVELPQVKTSNPQYEELFKSNDAKSKFFLKNIRRYNSMFSFTSMGGKIDKSVNKGKGPYVFRLSGQNYHAIGSLLPNDGTKPKFSQLDNKISVTYDEKRLDTEIITWEKDGRTYNLPTSSEVAALIVGDIEESYEPRDIVVRKIGGNLEYLNELHPSYMPLQYPLIFINGEDGYRIKIKHRGVEDDDGNKRPYTTMREWFAFLFQDRVVQFSPTLYSRRLLQQIMVDGYTMIESERLCYIRSKQKELRSVTFENLKSLKDKGYSDVSKVGQRIILSSSFIGGARYMMQNYLDAMTLCKWYGYPDFFITVTCNPKWPEVQRFLKDTSLNADDRPDILCRLFKIKLDSLIKDLKDNHVLGKLQAVVYTVEFQKRGYLIPIFVYLCKKKINFQT
ncbi:uncharacterized protein LOC143565409 [Bidens hawaiensis]|uniref:uncharacterized protein LOC143565409 n=1 Tax=Bidens hawaiensis TaxID=980011 RepID=UPI00404A2F51